MKLVKFIKYYRNKDYTKEQMEQFYRKEKILIQKVLDSFDDELEYLDKSSEDDLSLDSLE